MRSAARMCRWRVVAPSPGDLSSCVQVQERRADLVTQPPNWLKRRPTGADPSSMTRLALAAARGHRARGRAGPRPARPPRARLSPALGLPGGRGRCRRAGEPRPRTSSDGTAAGLTSTMSASDGAYDILLGRLLRGVRDPAVRRRAAPAAARTPRRGRTIQRGVDVASAALSFASSGSSSRRRRRHAHFATSTLRVLSVLDAAIVATAVVYVVARARVRGGVAVPHAARALRRRPPADGRLAS